MITLIIPVYNAAGYIDVCMDSVCTQTYRDTEVLLIDDGSTDGSASVCDQWAARDPRVRVIHKENGGVSSARNLGIEEAAGEWIAFVDPDDWLDPTYLEKLLTAAEHEGADFAECDLWRCSDRTGRRICRSCSGRAGVVWTLSEHMKYAPTASYKSISRRSLWTDNGVRFPDCAFESPAVYALILALAGRIASVSEPLYYYRIGRPGSLIETGYAHRDGSPNNTLGIEAMRHLISEFRRTGLYERYEQALEGIVKYRLSDILATQFHRKSEEDYRVTADNFRTFLQEAYPQGRSGRYITLGGYNLNRILVHMDQLHDPFGRFNFTSIIALASGEAETAFPVRHANRYREIMLQREERHAFPDILREMQPEYLFIDLTEERHGLLVRGSRYLTDSGAREGAEDPGPCDRRISRGDPEYQELFCKHVRALIGQVKELVPKITIVVVENYLAESFGDVERQQAYPEVKSIKEINKLLKQCYNYLRNEAVDAIWIDPAADPQIRPLLFTDGAYEYGVIPSHLNEVANRRIAAAIERRLDAVQGGEDS